MKTLSIHAIGNIIPYKLLRKMLAWGSYHKMQQYNPRTKIMTLLSIKIKLSIMTTGCDLAIANHGKKMHKYIILVVNQRVWNSHRTFARKTFLPLFVYIANLINDLNYEHYKFNNCNRLNRSIQKTNTCKYITIIHKKKHMQITLAYRTQPYKHLKYHTSMHYKISHVVRKKDIVIVC